MKKTMPAYLNAINTDTNMLEQFGQDFIVFRKFYKLVSMYSEKIDSVRCISHSIEQMEISITMNYKDQNLINHIQSHINDGIECVIDGLIINLKVLK